MYRKHKRWANSHWELMTIFWCDKVNCYNFYWKSIPLTLALTQWSLRIAPSSRVLNASSKSFNKHKTTPISPDHSTIVPTSSITPLQSLLQDRQPREKSILWPTSTQLQYLPKFKTCRRPRCSTPYCRVDPQASRKSITQLSKVSQQESLMKSPSTQSPVGGEFSEVMKHK
jgi:hypothetical protein